jgi:beta-phosphoglucomutase
MPRVKAVIFDMDGVLIEARDWHYDALNKALGLFGMEISRYDHLLTYDGLPTKKKLEMLSVERGLPSQLHEFINEMKQQYTMEIVYASCKPRFQHEYALSRLKREGYKLAVASNSVRKTVQVMIEQAALGGYLEFSLSNQDVRHGKPDPEIYFKAMHLLELQPEECLVVEDNERGIQAARGSGAWVMEVEGVEEVSYQNIKSHIARIEGDAS